MSERKVETEMLPKERSAAIIRLLMAAMLDDNKLAILERKIQKSRAPEEKEEVEAAINLGSLRAFADPLLLDCPTELPEPKIFTFSGRRKDWAVAVFHLKSDDDRTVSFTRHLRRIGNGWFPRGFQPKVERVFEKRGRQEIIKAVTQKLALSLPGGNGIIECVFKEAGQPIPPALKQAMDGRLAAGAAAEAIKKAEEAAKARAEAAAAA